MIILFIGMLLYEMHMPLIMLAQLRLNANVFSRSTASKEIRKGLDALRQSLDLMQYEPEGPSLERRIYEGALPSLPALEAFVQSSFPTK